LDTDEEMHSPAAPAAGEMTLSGAEHPSKTLANRDFRQTGGAESGALVTEPLVIDAELARIVAAWPTLADPIKRAVLSLVGCATDPPKGDAG
jgi:hypothetical protein